MADPRIYVASLTDYNAGRLHGTWVNLNETTDIDGVWEQVNEMLATSPEYRSFPQGGPAEEWAIHDYEGFGDYRVNEYDSFERLLAIAEGVASHGDAFLVFVGNDESVLEGDAEAAFEDAFAGEWNDEDDYARVVVEECGLLGLPADRVAAIDHWLDWGAITRSVMEDCWSGVLPNGNVAVFRNY